MKYLQLSTMILLLPTKLLAQHLEIPKVQEKYIVQNVQLDAKGENAIWTLKDADIQDNPSKVTYEPSKQDSSFWFKKELDSYVIYKVQDNKLFMQGLENKLTKVSYEEMEVFYKDDLCYGDSICGTFKGNGLYSDKKFLNIEGTYQTVVDGIGTLVLPDGNEIKNIRRFYTERTVKNDNKSLFVKEYRWYTEGMRLPCLEAQELVCAQKTLGQITYFTPCLANALQEPDANDKHRGSSQNSKDIRNKRLTKDARNVNSLFSFSLYSKEKDGQNMVSYNIRENDVAVSYGLFTTDGKTIYTTPRKK